MYITYLHIINESEYITAENHNMNESWKRDEREKKANGLKTYNILFLLSSKACGKTVNKIKIRFTSGDGDTHRE